MPQNSRAAGQRKLDGKLQEGRAALSEGRAFVASSGTKKAPAVPRVALRLQSPPGHCYAMDFVHDRPANGQGFECLTMIDLCSKEVPVIEADKFPGGQASLSH